MALVGLVVGCRGDDLRVAINRICRAAESVTQEKERSKMKAKLLPGSQLRDEAVTGPPVIDGCRPTTESRVVGLRREKEEGVEAEIKRRQRPL